MTSDNMLRKLPVWVLRSNAKAIFIVSSVLLLLVLGLWTFLLTRPLIPRSIDASQIRKNRPTQLLGVLAYLNKLSELPPVEDEINPLSVLPVQNTDLLGPKKWKGSSRTTDPTEGGGSVHTPPPKPKPKPVNIVFKGLFERTDGTVMALISDSASGKTAFYTTRTNVCGFTIVNIDNARVQVNDQSGQLVDLPLRKTVPFVEGKYVP